MTPEELQMNLIVVSNIDFSGVPKGTKAMIVDASNSWPETDSVCVEWMRDYDYRVGRKLRDWFSFDDLQYLDIVSVLDADRNVINTDNADTDQAEQIDIEPKAHDSLDVE